MPLVRKSPKHNYQCRHCSEIKQGRIIPSSYDCNTATLHSWSDLGPFGDKGYECSKCKAEVRSQGKPLLTACPGGENHVWRYKKGVVTSLLM